MPPLPTPRFFRSARNFHAWLQRNHDRVEELLVGFHKLRTGTPSVTYPQALDEALCFGWIDGIRRRIDEQSYTIRFTPRKARSPWSRVNIARAEELIAQGRMAPSGLAAYERRVHGPIPSYAKDFAAGTLAVAYEKEFRANREAWRFFQAQAPSYRRTAIGWVMQAKQETTRRRRLAELIETSAKGGKPKPFGY